MLSQSKETPSRLTKESGQIGHLITRLALILLALPENFGSDLRTPLTLTRRRSNSKTLAAGQHCRSG